MRSMFFGEDPIAQGIVEYLVILAVVVLVLVVGRGVSKTTADMKTAVYFH